MRKLEKLVLTNLLICCLLLYSHPIKATHKQPYQSQLEMGSAIANKNIEVLKEKINIHIDKDFRNARFVVKYTFRIKSDLISTPFLFFSPEEIMNFDTNVSVILDGKSVPVSYYSPDEIIISDFLLPSAPVENNIALSFGDFGNNYPYVGHYPVDDLMYVDTLLEEGIHTLQLEYAQSAWTDATNTLQKCSFHYSLSTAKTWRSFEDIEIHLLPDDVNQKYQTNLQGYAREISGPSDFTLKKLSEDFVAIIFVPQLNFIQKAASIVLANGFLLFVLISLSLLWLEWKWIKRYREKHPGNKYNKTSIIGGMIVPVLAVGLLGLIVIGLEGLAGPDIKSDGGLFSAILFHFMHYWWLITLLLILIFGWIDKVYKQKQN